VPYKKNRDQVLELFINYLKENHQWLFSGIGVFIISSFVALVIYMFKRKSNSANNVKQENIIAGGDVTGRDKKG
jgi:flagellar biosynthesis/type III secretory pathway M-ring protein FliF/YscJ|tara:strand:+ start:547 stop:768 length:222 start_codon:yes stop_codon:yes gene_type:complete